MIEENPHNMKKIQVNLTGNNIMSKTPYRSSLAGKSYWVDTCGCVHFERYNPRVDHDEGFTHFHENK